MIMLGDTHCFRLLRTHSSSVSSTCLLASTQATLRGLALYVSCGTLFHSCNQALRHVDYLFLTTCCATMFAVYLLSDLHGPPTAFPLSGHQCTLGVLAGTHWGALRCPGRMASGTKRQPSSAALLHCCSCTDTCHQTEIRNKKQRKRQRTEKEEKKREKMEKRYPQRRLEKLISLKRKVTRNRAVIEVKNEKSHQKKREKKLDH